MDCIMPWGQMHKHVPEGNFKGVNKGHRWEYSNRLTTKAWVTQALILSIY